MRDSRGRRGRRTHRMVSVAKERIDLLFASAKKRALLGQMELADRYVSLAFTVAKRYNVRLSKDQKSVFCRTCQAYLIAPRTAMVRVRGGRVIRHCLKCQDIRRIPLGDKLVKNRVKSGEARPMDDEPYMPQGPEREKRKT